MRVVYLTPALSEQYGWASYSLNLIRTMQGAGLALDVISAQNSPDVPGLAQEKRLFPAVPVPRGLALRNVQQVPGLRHLVQQADLIHATVELYAPLAAALAGKRPYVITAHGSYVRLPLLQRWPGSVLYRRAFRGGHLACVSHYTARIAQEVVPGVPTTVIPNGVQAQRYQALPPLPERPPRPLVLSSGGVKARKGTLELVRAIARVRQHVPDVLCVIAGTQIDERYLQRVQDEIARLELHEHVWLLGFVPEETLLGWYGAADVFVLPSINAGWKFEGFGLVYLEANAAGLPVIGTRDCGAEDAIVHGETGLLVSQEGLEDELPQAMLQLLQHPQRARAMGAAGQRRAHAHRWERVAQDMLHLYERLLNEGDPSP